MEWKPIKDFEDYLISPCGSVMSKKRFVNVFKNNKTIRKTVNEKILREALTLGGYAFVCLRKNNRHHNKRIHSLVAEAYISDRPKGLVINHKDGNKLNNDASNLEYVSMQRNTQHYYQSIGKSLGKVPINDIEKIINRVSLGEKIYKIAKEYNVTRNDIAVLCKIISITNEELNINL